MLAVLAEPRLALVGRAAWSRLWASILALQFVDAAAELFQRANHRLDPLRAQTEFFDQPHRAATAAAEPRPGGLRASVFGCVLLGGDAVVVGGCACSSTSSVSQVVRQAAQDLVFFQAIGHRDLHRAIERQFAVVHALAALCTACLNHVIALQQLAAEAARVISILLGQRDFLLPGEQRNFAHLRQVHAHRIVGPRFVLVADERLFLLFGRRLLFFVGVVDD